MIINIFNRIILSSGTTCIVPFFRISNYFTQNFLCLLIFPLSSSCSASCLICIIQIRIFDSFDTVYKQIRFENKTFQSQYVIQSKCNSLIFVLNSIADNNAFSVFLIFNTKNSVTRYSYTSFLTIIHYFACRSIHCQFRRVKSVRNGWSCRSIRECNSTGRNNFTVFQQRNFTFLIHTN